MSSKKLITNPGTTNSNSSTNNNRTKWLPKFLIAVALGVVLLINSESIIKPSIYEEKIEQQTSTHKVNSSSEMSSTLESTITRAPLLVQETPAPTPPLLCPIAPSAIAQYNQSFIEQCNKITQTRLEAETLWNEKQAAAYLYIQHSRKAGGTSFCMNLRMNIHGLIKIQNDDHKAPKRDHCQLWEFCMNCNYKKEKWYNSSGLANHIKLVMNQYQRNFIEFEGAGVPVDMTIGSAVSSASFSAAKQPVVANPHQWNDFLFLSTIRHPVDRLVSLLYSDMCRRNETCFKHNVVTFEEIVKKQCKGGLYYCPSNYFVRMFSGMDNQFSTNDEMLQMAQLNFLRFSCVVIVEHWDESLKCLRRIGLFRTLDSENKAYNVAGAANNQKLPNDTSYRNEYLSEEQLELVSSYNQADLKFYEWATKLILSGTFS